MKLYNIGWVHIERPCDSDCNNCPIIGHSNSRVITLLLNKFVEVFGHDRVYPIVEGLCPNLTVCYNCRVDDFVHFDGCDFVPKGGTVIK